MTSVRERTTIYPAMFPSLLTPLARHAGNGEEGR